MASRQVSGRLASEDRLTMAMALAPLAVDPSDAHAFVTAFLARWGEAFDEPVPGRRSPLRRRSR